MSTAYYYFAASLPMIVFGEPAPFSVENFLEDCERLLSPADLADIQLIWNPDPGVIARNRLVRAWLSFDHDFRNEMAWFRANEFNKDADEYLRGIRSFDPQIVEALAQAAKAGNPLEAEKILDQLRWNRIEDLARGHFFDMDILAAYALKLKILARYEVIASDQGAKHFEELKSAAAEVDI